MFKKLTLIIFTLLCVLSAAASAQTSANPEKQAAIKELVFLFNGNNKMEEKRVFLFSKTFGGGKDF